MNTQLLNQPNAGTFKTIIAAACLTFLFILSNSIVFGQSAHENKTGTYLDAQAAPAIDSKMQNDKQKISEEVLIANLKAGKMPYDNYKGIQNPKEAKKVWEAENPGAAKIFTEYCQSLNSNQKKDVVRKTEQSKQ